MTTKAAGGKITGLLALTFEAQAALDVKDPVHVVGDYEVALADGTKPVVGTVSVANKGRHPSTGAYPSAIVPGDCTVEARGFWVGVYTSGGAITAGTEVGIGAANTLVAAGAGVANIGIALTAAAGAGEDVDVLVN